MEITLEDLCISLKSSSSEFQVLKNEKLHDNTKMLNINLCL